MTPALGVAASPGAGVEWVEVIGAVIMTSYAGRRARRGVALELEREFA